MLRVAKFAVIVVIATWLLILPEANAIGFQPVVPDELKMTSEPQAPGAPAVILYRQVDRDDNSQTSHEDHYYRIKVLTEQGRSYANFEVPFDKEYEDIVNVHARTIKPDGSIVNFDGKVYEKIIQKAKGSKHMVKAFTLSDVQVGSIIEVSFTVDFRELYIFDSHWILSEELYTRKAQFSLKPYEIKPYQSIFLNPFRLRWIFQHLPPGAEAKQGPDGVVRMEANNIAAFPTEDFMPPENELKARVDFLYVEDTSEREPEKFWKHIGKSRNDSLESFVGKRKAMEGPVSQIVSAGDPPEVKLRKIYDRVQSLRNTTYELQKTEQEEKRAKEKSVDSAEQTWKRGYGDRETLTRLFIALARSAGFETDECWVSDRREYFFVPLTMENRKLNFNVALVKLNGKDVYLDPGVKFTPFGLLAWSESGTQGLKLDKDGGTWIRTPLPPRTESRIERNAKLKLTTTGDLEGKVTVTYIGLEAMRPRLEKRHADDVEHKRFLEDSLKEQIPAAAEVDLSNQPDWGNGETPLVAEFNVKIPGWVSSAGKRALISVGIFTAAEKQIFEHSGRVHPIYFEYSFEKVDDVSIELPAGWHTSSVPGGHTQDGHIVLYSLKVDDNEGTLHLTRTLALDAGIFDAKYYSGLRDFFQVVRSGDDEQIVLQPATASAHN